MTEDTSPAAWQDHVARKRAERLAEADQVWQALRSAGHQDDMALFVDFVHFGRDAQGAHALADQLRQTYLVEVAALPSGGWMVSGTTRPYGCRLGEASHRDWVGFMSEVGGAHGCVFSAWSVEAPQLGFGTSSEAFESRPGTD